MWKRKLQKYERKKKMKDKINIEMRKRKKQRSIGETGKNQRNKKKK